MPEKDPYTWDSALWAFLAGLGLAGGAIRYLDDLRKEIQRNPRTRKKFEIFEMLAKAISSAFALIVIYFICKGRNIDDLVALGLAGVSSYFGTESLGIVFRHFDKSTPPRDTQ